MKYEQRFEMGGAGREMGRAAKWGREVGKFTTEPRGDMGNTESGKNGPL